MGHDVIYYDTLQYDADCDILRYSIVHWTSKNRAEIQVAVYDLGSFSTSHYTDNPAEKLSRSNLI